MNKFDSESQFASASVNGTTIDDLWKEFSEHFPTDEAGFAELTRLILEELTNCSNCGSKQQFTPEQEGRLARCQACNKTIWVTAGTFFARIRKPRAWLFGISLLARGKAFSASEFHKVVGIAYSSSSALLKKVAIVIKNKMEDECYDRLASFCFSKTFSKRSRETPARQHPVDEEEGVERRSESASGSQDDFTPASDRQFDSKRGDERQSQAASAVSTLSKIEQEVFETLTDEPCHSDILCDKTGIPISGISSILTILELTYLVERTPGGLFKRSVANSGRLVNLENALEAAAVKAFLQFVQDHFHGISRKYLQIYLALFWCNAQRQRWSPGLLLRECIRFRAVSYKEILGYVSPHMVVTYVGSV